MSSSPDEKPDVHLIDNLLLIPGIFPPLPVSTPI